MANIGQIEAQKNNVDGLQMLSCRGAKARTGPANLTQLYSASWVVPYTLMVDQSTLFTQRIDNTCRGGAVLTREELIMGHCSLSCIIAMLYGKDSSPFGPPIANVWPLTWDKERLLASNKRYFRSRLASPR